MYLGLAWYMSTKLLHFQINLPTSLLFLNWIANFRRILLCFCSNNLSLEKCSCFCYITGYQMTLHCFGLQTQIQCFVMVRLVTGLGRFKAIKVLFGAAALIKMLCVLHLLLLTSQRMFSNPV
jgi:hypothetical protein